MKNGDHKKDEEPKNHGKPNGLPKEAETVPDGLFAVIPADQEIIVSSQNVAETRTFGEIIAERKP
jgi:hypothetical protein